MPTPAQIQEQVELERDQIRQGLEQLRNNTKKLEEKSYASQPSMELVPLILCFL